MGAQFLRELVCKGCRMKVRGAVDGIDGVGYEEPFVELEVVGRYADERVEEFAGLEERGVAVGV